MLQMYFHYLLTYVYTHIVLVTILCIIRLMLIIEKVEVFFDGTERQIPTILSWFCFVQRALSLFLASPRYLFFFLYLSIFSGCEKPILAEIVGANNAFSEEITAISVKWRTHCLNTSSQITANWVWFYFLGKSLSSSSIKDRRKCTISNEIMIKQTTCARWHW